ncbi:MAG: hypothetical protein ACI8WY_004169, partial [Planctomycetota bacterium]
DRYRPALSPRVERYAPTAAGHYRPCRYRPDRYRPALSPRVERYAPTAAGHYRPCRYRPDRYLPALSPRVERCAPTAAGRHREVGTGQVSPRHDRYQGSECRTARWLRHRAVFMRPSPDGAGAIMSTALAAQASSPDGRAAAQASSPEGPRGRASRGPHGALRAPRCDPGVLRTL